MYYQPKNYITTEVLMACAAAKKTRKKRNAITVVEVKELPENSNSTN